MRFFNNRNDPVIQKKEDSDFEKNDYARNEYITLASALKKYYLSAYFANIDLKYYKEKTLPINDSFIDLAFIRNQDKSENWIRTIQIEDFFSGKDSREFTLKRLLIEGEDGIGKSTLCKFIANCWAHDNKEKLGALYKQFPIIIWLPLEKIKDFPQIKSLGEFIYNTQLFQLGEPKNISKIDEALINLEDKHQVLYVYDGYDEISDLYYEKLTINNIGVIEFIKNLLSKEYYILTSRPYANAFPSMKDGSVKLEEIGLLRIMGFSNPNICKYVKKFFSYFPKNDARQSLLNQLNNDENIKNIARIPMHLTMLCTTWREGYQRFLPSDIPITKTVFYHAIIISSIDDYLKQNIKGDAIPLQESWPNDYLKQVPVKKIVSFLQELAWQLMQKKQWNFKPAQFANLSDRYFPTAVERQSIYKQLRILQGTGEATTNWFDQSYRFIYPSVQEFLVGWYVADHLEKQASMIRMHKYHPSYQLVWQFTAGLLVFAGNNYLNDSQYYFDLLLSEPKTFNEIDQLDSVWRCWNEAGLPEITQTQNLVDRLKSYIIAVDWSDESFYPKKALRAYRAEDLLFNCLKNNLLLRTRQEIQEAIMLIVNKILEGLSYESYSAKKLLATNNDIITDAFLDAYEKSSSIPSRINIISAIGNSGINNTRIENMLYTALDDYFIDIYLEATVAAGKLGMHRGKVENNLLSLLVNPVDAIRFAAIYFINLLGIYTDAIIHKLLEIAHSNAEPNIREIAVFSVGESKTINDRFIGEVLTLLNDTHEQVRYDAIGAVQRLGVNNEIVRETLLMNLNFTNITDKYRSKVIETIRQLKITDGLDITRLRIAFNQTEPNSETRCEVVVIMRELGIKNEDILLTALEDKVEAVFREAIITAGKLKISNNKIKELVLNALQNPGTWSMWFYDDITEAVRQLGINNVDIIKSLLPLLLSNQTSVRTNVVEVISKIGKTDNSIVNEVPDLLDVIKNLLYDSDVRVKIQAHNALANLSFGSLLLEIKKRSISRIYLVPSRVNLRDEQWHQYFSQFGQQQLSNYYYWSDISIQIILKLWDEMNIDLSQAVAQSLKDSMIYWYQGNLCFYKGDSLRKYALDEEKYLKLCNVFKSAARQIINDTLDISASNLNVIFKTQEHHSLSEIAYHDSKNSPLITVSTRRINGVKQLLGVSPEVDEISQTSSANTLSPFWRFFWINSKNEQRYNQFVYLISGLVSLTSWNLMQAIPDNEQQHPIDTQLDASAANIGYMPNYLSDLITNVTKAIFVVPKTTLAEHAAIINLIPQELKPTTEQLAISNANRTSSIKEQLIMGQYIIHYVRKYSPFTLPWNQTHILSDKEKTILQNNQKLIKQLEKNASAQRNSRTGQSGFFDDKFAFIHKTLSLLDHDIQRALKNNQATGAIFLEIQDRINRVEQITHDIAKQNKVLKRFEIKEQRLERRTRKTGYSGAAITRYNFISGRLTQEVVRHLPNPDGVAKFNIAASKGESTLPFSATQQFWIQSDLVSCEQQEPAIESIENTTHQLGD